MTLKDIDISETIARLKKLLEEEKNLSPALRSTIEMLLLIVTLWVNRLGLTRGRNSSKPPSSDPHRERKVKKKSDKKASGPHGHIGSTLKQVEQPDEIKVIALDKRTLPPRGHYQDVGCEKRQVIDPRRAERMDARSNSGVYAYQ